MHGKDIHKYEELKSPKAEAKSASDKYESDTERQDDGREQRDFQTRHCVQRIQDSYCSRSRFATCEDGHGGDPELTTTIRKSVIINEYEFGMASPNDTILTMTPLESSRKGRM